MAGMIKKKTNNVIDNVINIDGRLREPFGNLEDAISDIRNTCIDCPQCQAECAFLARYGTPWAILETNNTSNPHFLHMAYECSLCGLCGEVCPVGLQPMDLFFAMRRAAVSSGNAPLDKYKRIIAYEKRGTSRRYSYYSLPAGCDTVFFPGCSLPGTRPTKLLALYDHLKELIPSIGIVLDCCCKPSRDLGRTHHFLDMLTEMKFFLTTHGVKRIVTACPNCHSVFTTDGKPLVTQSVYEILAEFDLPPGMPQQEQIVTIHDACVTRYNTPIHNSIRKIASEKGLSIKEMPHNMGKTLCCGEGGSVASMDNLFSRTWKNKRIDEAAGKPMITYCAGCAQSLKNKTPVFHLIDLLFDPGCIASGKTRASRSPMTYLNRLWLKDALQRREKPAISRERTYCG